MGRLRRHLTYSNVMVTILAVLVVGGGGAYAAKKLKLKNNSVTTPKIRDGAVTGPKLGDGSVTGSKLAPGAVAAGNLDPNLLGDRSVGRGEAFTTADCTVQPSGTDCGTVQLTLPRAARVLVVADARAAANAGTASGACQLLADDVGITLGSQLGNVDVNGDFFALNGVTGVLGAGTHSFQLFCTQLVGALVLTDRHISAVSLSAD